MSTGWEALNAAIEEARTLIAAEAPDASVAAEGEAYVTRIVAAGLGGAVLGHLFREGGLTRALPVFCTKCERLRTRLQRSQPVAQNVGSLS
jgi:hypothetical protein